MAHRSRLLHFVIVIALLLGFGPYATLAQVDGAAPTWVDAMDGAAEPLLTEDSPDESRFTYVYADDTYKMQAHATDFSGDLYSYLTVGQLTDSRTSVNAAIEDDRADKYAFVGCRAGDGDNGYGFEVHFATGEVILWSLVTDDYQILAEGTASDLIAPGYVFNTIEIDCYQDLITGSINGEVALAAFDSTFSSGFSYIGGGVRSSNPAELFLVFDDLAVTTYAPTAEGQATTAGAVPAVPSQLTPVVPSTQATAAGSAFFDQLKAQALQQQPVAGPMTATLVQSTTTFPWAPAGVDLADVFVSATFINPMDTSTPWDGGISIRYTADNADARIILVSTGSWYLTIGATEPIASGSLDNFATGPGAANTLEIAAQGNAGAVSLNGQYIADLDLSATVASGDVFASSGFYLANTVDAREIGVQSFSVWDLSGGSSTTSQSTAAGGTDPASAFSAYKSQAVSQTPVFGPASGTLLQSTAAFPSALAGVNLADFYTTVTFLNPTDLSTPWNIGFGLRYSDTNTELRIVIDSTGDWSFVTGGAELVPGGQVVNFNGTAGGTNTLEAVAVGTTAYVALNGQLMSSFDLSGNALSGDVFIGTGFAAFGMVDGRLIPYENFTVWGL